MFLVLPLWPSLVLPFGSPLLSVKLMNSRDILIIEDDAAIRETMRDILEIQGYTVHTADDGKDGIEKLRQIGPPSLKDIPGVICSAYKESAKSVKPA